MCAVKSSRAERWIRAGLFVALTMHITAQCAPQATPYTPSESDVRSELSRRSQVPEDQLIELLSACDTDQLHLYFCSYREFVQADMTLMRLIADRTRTASASCAAQLDRTLGPWQQARNARCDASARKAFGNGTMVGTARVLCGTRETRAAIQRLQAREACVVR